MGFTAETAARSRLPSEVKLQARRLVEQMHARAAQEALEVQAPQEAPQPAPKTQSAAPPLERVESALSAEPQTAKQLADALGTYPQAIYGCLWRLQRLGRVQLHQGPRSPNCGRASWLRWSLPSSSPAPQVSVVTAQLGDSPARGTFQALPMLPDLDIEGVAEKMRLERARLAAQADAALQPYPALTEAQLAARKQLLKDRHAALVAAGKIKGKEPKQ